MYIEIIVFSSDISAPSLYYTSKYPSKKADTLPKYQLFSCAIHKYYLKRETGSKRDQDIIRKETRSLTLP